MTDDDLICNLSGDHPSECSCKVHGESTGLEPAAEVRIWDKSGLIEEAVVPDQSLFQTEEFNREDPGNLERFDAYLGRDIREREKKIVSEIRRHRKMVEAGLEQDSDRKVEIAIERLEKLEDKLESSQEVDD